ncbi:MAG TPA: response regulator [Terriglobales bacterium]|jgi:DNA-binding response OmpR family regulator|nr:response regulator [Terriglobales bacterium]
MSAQLKVLIADDEILIADTLGMILRQGGYDCQVAYSGRTALSKSFDFQPALLISDVIMPDMNGVEVAIRVREVLPSCEVLLLTGQAAAVDLMQRARAEGHDFDILNKPIHPDELLRWVSRRMKRGAGGSE